MFWWDLRTVINGGQIFHCVLYHKCSHSSLHSAYGEGEKETESKGVGISCVTYSFSFLAVQTPLSHCEWRGLDKPPLHWSWTALTFANFKFFFLFRPMQQPLLQINLGKLAFLMKIYRRLYPQTVNQLFPGTIHLFLQCELVYGSSPKLIRLLWGHGYFLCPSPRSSESGQGCGREWLLALKVTKVGGDAEYCP